MHAADHNRLTADLPDEAATMAWGAALGAVIGREPVAERHAARVVYLEGDLGAGKTTLVRGLLRGLNYQARVKSPTYTLVEPHEVSGLNLYHFDFYRFTHPEEYLEAGLEEYFAGNGVCLVEWPDKAAPYLPPADLRIGLRVLGEGRQIHLEALSEEARPWLSALTKSVSPAATSSVLPPPA